MGLRNRNSISAEQFYFVTTTVRNFLHSIRWTHIFTTDKYCDVLINNIKHYQKRYKFLILGYVIMPSRFHWIVKTEPEQGTISDIMRDIKKYTAWDILDLLREERPVQIKEFRKDVEKGQKHQL